MIAVIFEVWPKASMKSTYISIAESLAPLLQHVDGFLSIERFESLTVEGKILSLSFWRDEHAVERIAVERWERFEASQVRRANRQKAYPIQFHLLRDPRGGRLRHR